MRPTLLTAVIALINCSCASQLPLMGVSVDSVPSGCISTISGNDVHLAITNGSNRRISFRAYGESGPPFKLYPGAFQVLVAEPGSNEFAPWHVELADFLPPDRKVMLAPRDGARIFCER